MGGLFDEREKGACKFCWDSRENWIYCKLLNKIFEDDLDSWIDEFE